MATLIYTREGLVKAISDALYNFDPANTDCIFRSAYDEYAGEAEHIVKLFEDNCSLEEAFKKTFAKRFSYDIYSEAKMLEAYRVVNSHLA